MKDRGYFGRNIFYHVGTTFGKLRRATQARSGPMIPAARRAIQSRRDLTNLSLGLLSLKMALMAYNEHNGQWILKLRQNI